MNIILTTGYGRLHLIAAAQRLADLGLHIRLITGWIPQNADSLLVRLASRIVGRNLSAGFRKRQIAQNLNIETRSQAVLEGIDALVRRGLRRIPLMPMERWSTLAWKLWGFFSRRFITRDAQVFHIRSGAGQGGAIAKAKRLGLKVLVDHSIAHPAFMEAHLRPEFERYGVPFDIGISSPFWQLVDKDCREADVVMVNSFFVRDTFVEAGYAPEKIHVVYQGTREDFFGLRTAQPPFDGGRPLRILFTGGFGFRKGGEYILAALKELQTRGIAFEMDVVGSYDGSESIRAQYGADSLPIKFHGPVPQDDLKEFLRKADVYLFPSLAEGCASSGLEAMAAGLCVVATHESGLPIADGETGYLVPSKDSAVIADRLAWLVAHPNAVDQTGRAAAQLIAIDYTWTKYAENVKKVYEELTRSDNKRV